MWNHTVGTIFNAFFNILEISAAFVSQGIQGAIAEQAVEFLPGVFVAGIVFAIPVGEKGMVVFPHMIHPISKRCSSRSHRTELSTSGSSRV